MRSCILILLLTLAVDLCAQEPAAAKKRTESAELMSHQSFLDSAITFKTDIDRSLDYITRALESLPDTGQEKERAMTLTTLGEIYDYHQQYDLAAASYQDALSVYKTSRTTLLLGGVLIQLNSLEEAESILEPLLEIQGMVPYQRIVLFEYMGDIHAALQDTRTAVTYYEEGLKIAQKKSHISKNSGP